MYVYTIVVQKSSNFSDCMLYPLLKGYLCRMQGVRNTQRMFLVDSFFPVRDYVFMQPLLKEFNLINAIMLNNFKGVLERSVHNLF